MITTRQQIDIVEQLIGMVILCINTAAARLETHIDVFGDQHDSAIGVAVLQVAELIDDLVVIQIVGQTVGGDCVFFHQDGECAVGAKLAALNGDALVDLVRWSHPQGLVDQPDSLTAVGGNAGFT